MVAVLMSASIGAVSSAPSVAASPPASAGVQSTPTVDHVQQQWWYDALGLGPIQKQWTGEGVKITVIDGAINTSVPDLQGADIHLRDDCDGQPVVSRTDPFAEHGTAITNIIAGQGRGNGPGGKGILGVAPRASIDFWSLSGRTGKGYCDAYDGGPMMVKAAEEGADIISISIGSGQKAWDSYVEKAERLGAVVVCAAGQADRLGKFVAPARSPGAVAVYAVDKEARSWRLNPAQDPDASRFGSDDAFATISAPGVDMPTGGYVGSAWSSTKSTTGTSNAAPVVAGALALVKQKFPGATNNQLIQSLIHNPGGSTAGRKFGYEPDYGFGIVNIANMLAQDPTKWPDVSPLVADPQKTEKLFPTSVYGQKTSSDAAADRSAASGPSVDSSRSQGSSPLGWIVAAVVVVLVLVAGAAIVVRRRMAST